MLLNDHLWNLIEKKTSMEFKMWFSHPIRCALKFQDLPFFCHLHPDHLQLGQLALIGQLLQFSGYTMGLADLSEQLFDGVQHLTKTQRPSKVFGEEWVINNESNYFLPSKVPELLMV